MTIRRFNYDAVLTPKAEVHDVRDALLADLTQCREDVRFHAASRVKLLYYLLLLVLVTAGFILNALLSGELNLLLAAGSIAPLFLLVILDALLWVIGLTALFAYAALYKMADYVRAAERMAERIRDLLYGFGSLARVATSGRPHDHRKLESDFTHAGRIMERLSLMVFVAAVVFLGVVTVWLTDYSRPWPAFYGSLIGFLLAGHLAGVFLGEVRPLLRATRLLDEWDRDIASRELEQLRLVEKGFVNVEDVRA